MVMPKKDDGRSPLFPNKTLVRKIGSYDGEGEVVCGFRADDGTWRYVVAHRIEHGSGRFYHIYVASNLSRVK